MPSQSVGASLRAARLRLGEELAEAAAVLRIRAVFLQAIEEGHFEALPGVPYAIGFVRTYAEHLGLDGPDMVRRFKSEAAGLERKTNLSFPSPAPEGRVPGTAALLISLIAAAVVFGGWYLYQNGTTRLALRVPEVPERLANPAGTVPPAFNMGGLGDTPSDAAAGAPSLAGVPNPTPGGSVAGAVTPSASPPAPASVASSAATPTAIATPGARPGAVAPDPALPPPPGDPTRRLTAATPTPAVPPAGPATAAPAAEPEDSPPPDPTNLAGAPGAADRPGAGSGTGSGTGIPPVPQVAAAPSDGRVFGAQNSDSRVVIKAHGESWVQIRDAANAPLLTRVLRPGDTYRVPNQPGLTMMTGNAGVLDVFVDGNAAPALGAVGAVRRNIALDADRLRTGAAGTQ